MLDTLSILKKAADKAGFNRARFEDRKVPTSISNVSIMTLFGDVRSTFVASSMLLHRFRKEMKGSRYFILCGWPGYEGLFPYVDEYWSIRLDEPALQKLWKTVDGLGNTSSVLANSERHLNYFVEDRLDWTELVPYYNCGLKKEFFDKFRHVQVFLPTVPSLVALGDVFLREVVKKPSLKVFIHPSLFVTSWRNGKARQVNVPESFWVALVNRLADEGFMPVVYLNECSHNISSKTTGKCYFLSESNLLLVLSAMRSVGYVLDLFQGISRLAIAARCPFLLYEERTKYKFLKDFEIDDLCAGNLPKEYIFGFSTILENEDKTAWNLNFFDGIIARLNSVLPTLDRNEWPSTNEYHEIISYQNVRKQKSKKLGTRLLHVSQD
jgi:hypothetical protein